MIALVKTRKLGLESFEVRLNGRCLYSFLSEAAARTKYIQLKQKLIAR